MERIAFMVTMVLFFVSGSRAFSQMTKDKPWGDQGNGTYINPVLNADYSDPDVVRVGEDYYMVCSEFHFMGMPVLHSKDLVNWTIIGRIYSEFKFAPEYDTNKRYSGGSWAPAIRYHNNKFYVYFCTPQEGLFMSSATNPEGPWEPLVQVFEAEGWEDPCPMWDDDGDAYLGHSRVGAGPIIIHRMSEDGKKLLDSGFTVYTGPVAEGTKFLKRNGYYYLSIPEGGVPVGWQTILRSKNIYGPYEKKVVLEQGSTPINGPHQGAMVELPNGDWWFIHFQELKRFGRVLHLQPMHWENDWPVMGIDIDRNGIGEPVYVWKKPNVGKEYPVTLPQTSDDFNSQELGFQWAWNHNPDNRAWSLTNKSGFLQLTALKASSLTEAKNTLTQRTMGYQSVATTCLYAHDMKNGQKAGLCILGKPFNEAGLVKRDGKLFVFVNIDGIYNEQKYSSSRIYLRIYVAQDEKQNQFSFSTNDKEYKTFGTKFTTNNEYGKGPILGLFSYNEEGQKGIASFDWFHYHTDELN